MKRKYFVISIVAFAVAFSSCNHLFLDEDIFGESPANRLAANAAEALAHLQSAPNGWEMHYFPTNTQIGHVLLVRFGEDGMATMMGRNVTTNNQTATGTGTYRVRTIQTTVLSFDSENPIIHEFANPSRPPQGQGMQGDFEFVIVSHSPDVVHLRGVKRNTHVEMRRLPDNQDWSVHLDKVDEMRDYLFSTNPLLVLNIGNEQFSFANGRTSTFVMPIIDENIAARRVPFVVTAEGITLSQNFVEENSGNAVRRFVLNEERTQLIAADVNFDSRIQIAPAIDVFIDNLNNGTVPTVFGSSADMSADIHAVYTMVEDKIASFSISLNFIGFVNHRTIGPSLVVEAGAVVGFIGLDVTKVGDDELSITATGIMDANGRVFYEQCDVSFFIAMLAADTYSVSFQDGGFAPTTFRFQSRNNPNKWFDLFFR